MPHLPFTPNHVLLVSACYPNNAALLATNAEFKPNSQELSRLTYYAANRPGKINKLGQELEKRTTAEAKKAKAGNVRMRATLLVTLSIFKAVVSECKRDLSLLASHPLAAVDTTLGLLSADLEVAARAASLFTAWTTYTDGHLMGVDVRLTDSYMSALKVFASMSAMTTKSSDKEVQNRTRLIGLGAVMAAVASEALYGGVTHFRNQAQIIMDATISILHHTPLETLEEVAFDLKEKPASPIVAEFRARPLAERRAASIYAHVDGQEGPTQTDVAQECIRTLSLLLTQCNASQVSTAVQAALDSLERCSGWDKPETCAWLAQRIVEWTQYQYRYAVPSLLVERLLEVKDTAGSATAQRTMLTMLTSIFASPTPLNNLATSDIVSNIIGLLLRRITLDQEDELLSPIVECIASLGVHIYYTDQIQDLAGEIIGRILILEGNTASNQRKLDDGARSQAIRCLLHALVGLVRSADRRAQITEKPASPTLKSPTGEKPSFFHSTTQMSEATIKASDMTLKAEKSRPAHQTRRTKVEAEVWQDTLTLLCDGDYSVRSDYFDSLIFYLQSEISKDGEFTDADGVRRIRRLADGPTRQASTISALLVGDVVTRLLNGLHAYLYMLTTSESLGHNQGPRTPSRSSRSVVDAGSMEGDPTEESDPSATVSTSKISTRSRRTSMTQRIVQSASTRGLTSTTAATVSDYAHVLAAMNAIHEQLPVRGLLTGVPMLIALTNVIGHNTQADEGAKQRVTVVREVVARTWLTIGRVWAQSKLCELADQALAPLASSNIHPLSEEDPGIYHAPRTAAMFPLTTSPSEVSLVDGVKAARILAACASAQDATGMDEEALFNRLTSPWSIELALHAASTSDVTAHNGDAPNPILKIAPALMHIENLSLASLNQTKRGVGINDLREALSGRNSMSNAALSGRAPSVATADRVSSILPELALRPVKSRTDKKRGRIGSPNEVRDVLSKLGIGPRPTNSTSMLRPSGFPPTATEISKPLESSYTV